MSVDSATVPRRSTDGLPSLDVLDAAEVKTCLKLYGVVLIAREGATVSDFEALTDQMMTPTVHHATSTIERDAVNATATTSTVNKGMDPVPLHREGSYAPMCPDLLAFYCVQPAADHGETTVCDGAELLASLSRPARTFVEGATLRWTWSAPPERWRAMLGVSSVAQATAKLTALGAQLPHWEHLTFGFDGELLRGAFETPCATHAKWDGRRAFCNSLLIHHFRQASGYFAKQLYDVSLVDGRPFPSDVLDEVAERARPLTHGVTWRATQILLVDNSRFMHGRNGFADPQRKVLIRMGHARQNF
jgi:alpha-ketoglutarate-dependent taurine dioxygenase